MEEEPAGGPETRELVATPPATPAEGPCRPLGGSPGPQLSARERDALRLLAGGATTQELCTALAVNANTLKQQLWRLRHKLGVSSNEEAVRRARQMRLLP